MRRYKTRYLPVLKRGNERLVAKKLIALDRIEWVDYNSNYVFRTRFRKRARRIAQKGANLYNYGNPDWTRIG